MNVSNVKCSLECLGDFFIKKFQSNLAIYGLFMYFYLFSVSVTVTEVQEMISWP